MQPLKTLAEVGTWELVDLPAGANLVGSKWVFRLEKDAAGQVVRSRLVAQGCDDRARPPIYEMTALS